MVGDPAPWFTLPSTSNPAYHFESVGGYRVILSFLGGTQSDRTQQALNQFAALQHQLEALNTPFFGVLSDPDDSPLQSLIEVPSYFKLLWDFDRTVSLLYGVCRHSQQQPNQQLDYVPTTFVLNQNLQVMGVFELHEPADHVAQVMECVQQLPVFELPQLAARQAPVLLIPHVFDRDLCQHLIHLYETHGGSDSGFMRQIDGKTVEVFDYGFKKRRDFLLEDPILLQRVNDLILRRVKPEIEKAFQFTITRFERHLVGCYESGDRGFFNRHRDNTTKGTAHRRFAMSLNLNTGDYEGGCLRFPEYGSQLYRPNVGEAVIFSCSLLHEATPVTCGRRFALLSFFYNDDDAKVREQNRKYLATPHQSELGQMARSKSPSGFQMQTKKKSTARKSKG